MPASTTTLTVTENNDPGGGTFDEQDSDATNGNSFPNARGTVLYVRNSTAGAIDLEFFTDLYGVETTLLTESIPGSGTENGVKVLGGFPADRFNDHSTTDAAKNGHVMCRQASGAAGDLKLCPVRPLQ